MEVAIISPKYQVVIPRKIRELLFRRIGVLYGDKTYINKAIGVKSLILR